MINTIETISQKEYLKIGSKFKIYYDFHDTIFGICLIAIVKNHNNSVCHLAFIGEEREKAIQVLREKWYVSHLIQDNEAIKVTVNFIFSECKDIIDGVNVLLKGTDFQIVVWKALTQIPSGSCVTYEQVAKMINNPRAVRAVANALAANQVCYLIPCHRVICKNGCNKFTSFGGIKVKEKMQQFEKEEQKLKFSHYFQRKS